MLSKAVVDGGGDYPGTARFAFAAAVKGHDAVAVLLETAAVAFTGPDTPAGCLVANSPASPSSRRCAGRPRPVSLED